MVLEVRRASGAPCRVERLVGLRIWKTLLPSGRTIPLTPNAAPLPKPRTTFATSVTLTAWSGSTRQAASDVRLTLTVRRRSWDRGADRLEWLDPEQMTGMGAAARAMSLAMRTAPSSWSGSTRMSLEITATPSTRSGSTRQACFRCECVRWKRAERPRRATLGSWSGATRQGSGDHGDAEPLEWRDLAGLLPMRTRSLKRAGPPEACDTERLEWLDPAGLWRSRRRRAAGVARPGPTRG